MDSLEALAARRAQATETDAVSGFVFTEIVALLSREQGEAEATRLATRLPRRLIPLLKYPAAQFLGLVEDAAASLDPSRADVSRTLGRIGASTIGGYLSSPMGAIVTSLNAGAAHRILQIAPTALATIYAFGSVRTERTSAHEARLVCRRQLFGPAYLAGLLAAGLERTCATHATLSVDDVSHAGADFTLSLCWDAPAPH